MARSGADIRRALARSPLFDGGWYLGRYPDVQAAGFDPLDHYIRLGHALGRDPSPCFSTRGYLAANPDVAAAGCNALHHFVTAGQAEGRGPGLGGPFAPGAQTRRVMTLRWLLQSAGLTDGPLTELRRIAQEDHAPEAAALAAETLARWEYGAEDAQATLLWLDRRRALGPDPASRQRLAALELLAAVQAEGEGGARRRFDALASLGASRDLWLAATRIETDEQGRLAALNHALAIDAVAPVTLRPGSAPAFDRLAGPTGAPGGSEGPLVSVLMAAHNSAATIGTAIGSILAQDWRALELIVIDDASTDDTPRLVAEVAARDSRVRSVRLDRNVGAYAARNIGLAQAAGDYVTLQDADDWSHPGRIRGQTEYLLRHRGDFACMSRQARADAALRFGRPDGTGALALENLSSLLLPRAAMLDCLGGWDEVRVSADSELLRRARRLFGPSAVPTLPSLWSITRDDGDSATREAATGMDWFYYGARLDYFEAQTHHHRRATALVYPPAQARPFPAPRILLERGSERREIVLDRVCSGLFSTMGPELDGLIAQIRAETKNGQRIGLVPLFSLQQAPGEPLTICPELREVIDGTQVQVLCYGQTALCHTYRRLPGMAEPSRYLPKVLCGDTIVLEPGRIG